MPHPRRLRAMRRPTAGLVLLLIASCTPGDAPPATPQPPAETAEPMDGEVVLRLTGLRLDATAEPGAERVRVTPGASNGMRVTVIGASGAVDVCPAGRASGCVDGTGGSPVEMDADAVEVRATSDVVGIDAVEVAYRPAAGRVEIRRDVFAPGDAFGVERSPRRAGDIAASATWDGVGGGRLTITEGEEERARAEGSSDAGPQTLRATAAPDPDARVAVVFACTGARALRAARLSIDWP